MRALVCFAGLLCLMLVTPVHSRTWYITPDGASDAPTIQAGIDSAAAGDTVMLADGTFLGPGNHDISYQGKALTVMSESENPDLCAITCGAPHRGFLFNSGEGSASVLSGVSIIGGETEQGAGLYCQGTSPTLTNLVLSWNNAYTGGGIECTDGAAPALINITIEDNIASDGAGMYCDNSSPILTNVTFRRNVTHMPGSGGGMVCINGGSPELTNVRFKDNFADGDGGGMLCANGATPILTDVVFWDNHAMASGGGLRASTSLTVTNCTFFSNGAGSFGSAVAIWGGASPTIERTIITNSSFPEPVYVQGGSSPVFICCNIWGNAGGDWIGRIAGQLGVNGNFSADPLFCDTEGADFTVESCSPCLPGNHPDGYDCGGIVGTFGEGCACGAATQPTTWGAVKSMYK